MGATTVLERPDGSTFQVTAGESDTGGPRTRYLVFGVPDTNDSVRLDWDGDADLATGGPVPVSLRVGTLPAQPGVLADHTVTVHGTPGEPTFGPNVEAILKVLAEAYLELVTAHPETVEEIEGKIPKWHWAGKIGKGGGADLDGKIGKGLSPDVTGLDPERVAPGGEVGAELGTVVAQYAAAGSSIGVLISGTPAGAAVGAAIGAAAGVAAYLTGVPQLRADSGHTAG
ncbi:MAG TPA: hypothetical protein VFB84_21755 [Micromonosporaceae bacterium]|nr:hypothetical protein [Micromonosporaceae bacterium]